MDTTAEGVETHDELDLIRRHGCSHVQGFIFDRALTMEQAMARMADGLDAVAKGPKSSRASRQKMLRKVVLDHDSHLYNATIRNISVTGAMVEGLWNVPVGTVFNVHISTTHVVSCTTRWSVKDRMGVEFGNPLQRDSSGQITAIQGPPPQQIAAEEMREAG